MDIHCRARKNAGKERLAGYTEKQFKVLSRAWNETK